MVITRTAFGTNLSCELGILYAVPRPGRKPIWATRTCQGGPPSRPKHLSPPLCPPEISRTSMVRILVDPNLTLRDVTGLGAMVIIASPGLPPNSALSSALPPPPSNRPLSFDGS
ncbi:hypothetical protein NL676_026905 [Syzygium grande]|nr:hypothetical protein NL676_026905 [Syzygium grande]